MLVRAQICVLVVQRRPLVTGGGGQLLLVCGVVVLLVQRGRIVYGRRILQHRDGGSKFDGKGTETGSQIREMWVKGSKFTPGMFQRVEISLATASL